MGCHKTFNHQSLAENTAQLIEQILIKEDYLSCDVIGHSMGGYVALSLYPKLISSKIILLNSNFWADSQDKTGSIKGHQYC